ncbi:alpha/beta hydrolase family protein [Oceanobacillus manasiensis]|uniref:alpha/beta hydrolase family protein n=1 Tax=Oceanobacillus manasiensis TaxID=586413 RepID=UPI0006939EFB|nr:alpha/beta hydrolase [Oceanobacillus manasiensis]
MSYRTGGFLLACLVFLLVACASNGEDGAETMTHIGNWNGEIIIPGQPLEIEMTLDDEKGGTISIPAQGLEDYPLSTVEIKEDQQIVITMTIQGQVLSFDGTLNGQEMTGTFTQNGQAFPFELVKGNKEKEAEEDGEFLSIETEEGTLYGEIETPNSEGPHPVMLIIPGSGPTDRNGNSPAIPGKNDSLKLLAEELAENGIASLRYDKRGAGKNQQAVVAESSLKFEQFIEDAQGWLDLLANDPSYTKIGVIGHSQGSLTGIMAAQATPVDAFISLAGAGRPMNEVLYEQLEEQLSNKLLEESKAILDKLKNGEVTENVADELHSVFRPAVQPFLVSWMQYDPANELAKLSSPVLIVQGEHDIQVNQQEGIALQEASPEAEMVTINGMNHVLKEAPKEREANLQTYSDPSLPVASELMDEVIRFLNQHHFISE